MRLPGPAARGLGRPVRKPMPAAGKPAGQNGHGSSCCCGEVAPGHRHDRSARSCGGAAGFRSPHVSAAGSAMAGRHPQMPQPGYPPVVRHCSRRMRELALQEPRVRAGRTRRRPDGCGPRRPAPGWRRPGPARPFRRTPHADPSASCMADRWSLRLPAAGIVVARARTARSPGLVIRRLPGWADSASGSIVTVRRRVWGQIRRFRRRVPLPHPAPSASITASSIPRTAASRSATPGGRCP